MPNYQLNAKNPADPRWEHKPQAEFLQQARSRLSAQKGIKYLNYVGGRGCAKTTSAILDMFNVACIETPQYIREQQDLGKIHESFKGFRTFWSARTDGEIDNVLLNELERMVPDELYKVGNKKGARFIQWASGHKTFLISRKVDNPNARVGLGVNVIGGWHDEAATGFLIDKFTDINNAIREPKAPYYFCVTTSTPLPNAYQMFCESEKAVTVKATSYDSPFLDKENLDDMASMMDEMTVKQELMGEFVITTGKIWDTFVEKPWPEGNILEGAEFDHSRPFYLGVDLGGSQSAIQVVQYFEPLHPITGRKMFEGKLAVVVAEYVPNQMGIEEVVKDIVDRYCDGDHNSRKPALVCIGHDVNSSTVVGDTGAEFFTKLGWQYSFPRGAMFRKHNQRSVARSLILNSKGERRFAVAGSKNKHGRYVINEQMFGANKQRGILNVMRNDTYGDDKSEKTFTKDKAKAGKNALEDDRDAMLYWMSLNHPMKFNVNINMPV